MSEPFSYPIRTLYAKASCPKCHGIVPEDTTDYCECIEDQLLSSDDFVRLADGLIDVVDAE